MPELDLPPQTISADIGALRQNLASRLAYVVLYRAFQAQASEEEIRTFLQEALEEDQGFMGRLAQALRRRGRPVDLQPDAGELLKQFYSRRTPLARLEFLRQGAAHAAQWYGQRAGDPTFSQEVRELFAEGAELQRRRAKQVQELMEHLHHR
ncbi:MAG: hypothetical protein ACP5TV_10560 [Anaerolineae bacterium]